MAGRTIGRRGAAAALVLAAVLGALGWYGYAARQRSIHEPRPERLPTTQPTGLRFEHAGERFVKVTLLSGFDAQRISWFFEQCPQFKEETPDYPVEAVYRVILADRIRLAPGELAPFPDGAETFLILAGRRGVVIGERRYSYLEEGAAGVREVLAGYAAYLEKTYPTFAVRFCDRL